MEVAEVQRDSVKIGHRVTRTLCHGAGWSAWVSRCQCSVLSSRKHREAPFPTPPPRPCRNSPFLQFATLIQIEIPQRFFSGLVFGLFKGFPELTVKQFRLGFLVVRALTEQGFATIGFLLQKL